MADKTKKENSKIETLYDWISVDLQGVKEELMVELKLSAAQIASMYDSMKNNSEESTSAIAQEIRYSYKQNQNIYDGMAALIRSEVAQKLDSMDEKMAFLERLGYRTRFLLSTQERPKPIVLWHNTWARILSWLNLRDRPQRKTTGNSRPLDLWILMI